MRPASLADRLNGLPQSPQLALQLLNDLTILFAGATLQQSDTIFSSQNLNIIHNSISSEIFIYKADIY